MPAAVVLAGGGPEPGLAPDLPNKAFLVIGGRPLVVRVTDALRKTSAVERILVVGPPAPLASLLDASFEVIPDQGSMMGNITAAVDRLSGAAQLLAVAADLPLITAQAVEGFLRLCTGDAGCYYPIVPQAAIERRFPGARKTYVRVSDGVFCGCSVLLFDRELIDRVRPLVEQVIAGRKKPWVIAKLFGWSLALKFSAGTLSIAEVEARVHVMTGIRAKAVVLDGPELALDIDADRPENHKILRAALEPDGRSEA